MHKNLSFSYILWQSELHSTGDVVYKIYVKSAPIPQYFELDKKLVTVWMFGLKRFIDWLRG